MIERPLRIGYVLPVLEPGGAERQVVLLASAMPPNRGVPELIVLGSDGPAVEAARAAGLVVHVLGASRERDVGRVAFALEGARLAARFVQLVRRRRYDILDAWLFPAYALVAVTRPFIGVRTLVAGRRSLARWKTQFGWSRRLVDAWARRMSDAIVANSEAVAEDAIRVEGLRPERVHVIRNGIGPAPTPTDRDRADWAELRRSAGVPADGRLIGCVANPRPEKGLGDLLAALAVRPLPPDVRVAIVGDGPGRPDLERETATLGLETVVHWAGSRPDARRLQPAYDIVVGPSRAEGLPNAILEAAAAGRPIVATRAGGTGEVLTDGRTGLLVQVGDPIALRSALDRLLDDPALAMRLGAAAADDVMARFSVQRLVDETLELYASLLSHRTG